MKQLPCRNCIVLSICKTKKRIECDILYRILAEKITWGDFKTSDKDFPRKKNLIIDLFPNVKEITTSERATRIVFKGFK